MNIFKKKKFPFSIQKGVPKVLNEQNKTSNAQRVLGKEPVK